MRQRRASLKADGPGRKVPADRSGRTDDPALASAPEAGPTRPGERVLRLENLSKSFGNSKALDDVTLQLEAGSVRALLGQNGSGKSTLVKVLTGFYTADAGRLWLWDHYEPMPILSPSAKGLAVIHQDLGLVRNQTALENFCIGSEEWSSYFRPVRWGREEDTFRSYSQRLGFGALAERSRHTVAELAPGERTIVAVMRALRQLDDASRKHGGRSGAGAWDTGRALILDEPTVFLGNRERAVLGDLLEALTATGVGVLLISHDFHDVFEFARQVSVLRDGRLVYDSSVQDTTEETLVEQIAGGAVGRMARSRENVERKAVALEFSRLETDKLHGVDLTIHQGEVVGITGLAGMGHEELPYAAAGLRNLHGGTVRVRAPEGLVDIKRARRRVGLVPSDRAGNGVWLDGSVRENLSIARVDHFTRWGLLRIREEKDSARALVKKYRVVVQDPEKQLWTLSGGNQQKVLVARVLEGDVTALVLDEPTQGVDVGAAQQIMEVIGQAADRSLGILVSSIDHDLLTAVCDRVAVMRQGVITDMLEGQALNVEAILSATQSGGVVPYAGT